jgi:glycosyltransferase involved in cell wall biosynthesis
LIEDLGSGGAERLLFVNLSRLDRSSFTGMVCHLYDRAQHWRQPILDLGYPVESLGVRSVYDLPRSVLRLLQILKQHPVDLIHTHLYRANLVGRLAGAMAGVPVVSSLHSPEYESAMLTDNPTLWPAKAWLIRQLDRLSCWLARPRFIAVSEYVRQSAIRRLGIPKDRTAVVYNSIDLDAFRPSAEMTAAGVHVRTQLGIVPGQPVVLCVARYAPQKGLRYLVEAMPRLVEQFPQVVTLVVGGGSTSDQADLERRAEGLGVRSHIRFLGVKEDVRPYLELCDVFVLPSLFEGLGIALVEAMAMQRACVASRATAIPEVVEDEVSGLLVTPGDSADLSRAVARLLADPARRSKMGAAGRRIATSRFNIAENIGHLEAVYRRASAPEEGATT